MRKLLLVILIILGGAHRAAGQASAFYPFRPPIPNTTVRVCPVPSGGRPCPAPSAIFRDSALSQPITNPFTTGNDGNFGFWATPGQYTVQLSGAIFDEFVITLGGGGAGGSPPVGNAGDVQSTTAGHVLQASSINDNGSRVLITNPLQFGSSSRNSSTIPITGATPTVSGGNAFSLSNGSATTITNLVGGLDSQIISITCADANETFANNANIVLLSGINTPCISGQAQSFMFSSSLNQWQQIGNSGGTVGAPGDFQAKLDGLHFQSVGMNQITAGSQTQIQSYGFTTVENPLSDKFQFQTTAINVPSSGVAQPTAANTVGTAIFVGQLWPRNQYSEITLITGNGNTEFLLYVNKGLSVNTNYNLDSSLLSLGLGHSTTFLVNAVVAGTSHQIDTFTATPNVNDKWRLQLDNNVLTIYQNGTLVHTTVDNIYSSQIPGAYPGFALYNFNSASGVQVSLWAAGGATSTITMDPGHVMIGSLQGNVSLKPVINVDAIQYVSDDGSDGNDGLSWGSPKKSIYFACEALIGGSASPPTCGAGTIYVSGGFYSPWQNNFGGGPQSGGLWLMGPQDPNFATPPAGWLRFNLNSGQSLNIIGVPSGQGGPNTHSGSVNMDKGAGLVAGDPAFWFSNTNQPINISGLNGGGGSRFVLIGQCSTGTRTGTCVSSNITFKDVGGAANFNSGSGPCEDITGASFWIWHRDFACAGNATNATGGRFANNAAAILIDGTGNAGIGLITFHDLNTSAGGIKVIPGASGNNIFVDNYIEEGDFTHDVPPAVWFTNWIANPGQQATLYNVGIADPGPTPTPCVQIDTTSNPSTADGPVVIGGGCPVLGQAKIINSSANALNATISTSTPLRLGQTGVMSNTLVGQTDLARRNDSLVATRFLNRASSDPTVWVSQDPTHSTITTGLTDLFGGTKAASIIRTVAGSTGFQLQTSPAFSYTSAVGDWVVMGVWEQGLGGDTNLQLPGTGITASVTYQDNALLYEDRWSWRWKAFKISNINSNPLFINLQYSNANTVTLYGPVLYVIPNGTLVDNEVVDFASTMATTDSACPVGGICNVPGHPVQVTSLAIGTGNQMTAESGNSGTVAQSSGTLLSGDVAVFDVNHNIVDGGAPGALSVRWSSLTAPTGPLTLAMTTAVTNFNHTTNTNGWFWNNITAATSSVSQSSPLLNLCGTAWNGSASITDCWQFSNILNNGTNGASTFTFAHSGSTGPALVNAPAFCAGASCPAITAGTSGIIAMVEGTDATNVANTSLIDANGVSHEFTACTNGSTTCGMLVRRQPSAVHQTGQTAAISTATLCATAAGACNVAGQYHVHFDFIETGTACSAPGPGAVTFLLTWTDTNATVHSAVVIPMLAQTGATSMAQGNSFTFASALANAGASGDMTIATNGAVIQYATGYTACTTGTGTYQLDAVVTRLQ